MSENPDAAIVSNEEMITASVKNEQQNLNPPNSDLNGNWSPLSYYDLEETKKKGYLVMVLKVLTLHENSYGYDIPYNA